MCKLKKTEEQKQEEVKYPQYLSNKPEGEDLFDGKSQERLAKAVANHISAIDAAKKPSVSRLLGLEGKWGSGKSNVIGLLKNELPAKYSFFCFDAWGNQEDLQRRSILELLTKELITREKLTGKTTMRVMKPEGEGKVEEIECTWKEKLESLLSRKSYTRDITVPAVNNSTKWFVLSLLAVGLVLSFLSVDKTDIWWANILIALSPLLLFTLGMVITWSSWPKMFAMYNTEGKSDTTSYVINEQEPSVREFKEWMIEISKGLPIDEKLVLVLDNMDRLPARKVQQFWSLIQTFFADDGYPNIWCIIPYDEEHLATAFSESADRDVKTDLLRGYLDKTFPVVYRVAEPIVSDYKAVFGILISKAFGDTISEENKELISRCYRHERPTPNVREIISFLNEMVALSFQWGSVIHPVSMAVFALKKDEILRNPVLDKTEGQKVVKKKVGTEEYIISNGYLMSFRQILYGNDAMKNLQREIAALVYGVMPDNALQIVIKRYIRNCFTGADKNPAINRYAGNGQFMSMLEEEVHDAEITAYDTAVKLIGQIDEGKLTAEGKKVLAKIWKFFGERYVIQNLKATEFTDYEQTIFSHVPQKQAESCAATFCKGLLDNKDVDGGNLFAQLEKLFICEFAASFEINKICPAIEIEAKRFLDYVSRAGDEYQKYPLTAKNNDVIKVLEESIGDEFPYYSVLMCLKNDESYNVKEVGDYAVKTLNEQQAGAAQAYQLISTQRLFYDKLQSKVDSTYIHNLWQDVQRDNNKPQYDEIYVWKAATSYEQIPDDDRHIDLITKKVLFYTSTAQWLKEVVAYRNINYRKLSMSKMIKEMLHDGLADYSEFIENWQNIVSILHVTKEEVVSFADSWGMKDIPEPEKTKGIFTLLADVSWIDTLLASETKLSGILLEKCANELVEQDVNQIVQPNSAIHTTNNWGRAFQKLIGTKYLKAANLGNLNKVAETLLDFEARNGAFSDDTWNLLFDKVKFSAISTAVNEIRRKILNGQSGYAMTPEKFKMLHCWLEKAEMNSAERCTDAANYVLSKVVDDAACQEIILANNEYYRPIIENTTETASALHDKLKKIVQSKGYFADYLRGIVKYEDAEDVKE